MLPGVCSLPESHCCVLLLAFISETVWVPAHTGLNGFGITKVAKIPPVASMGAEPEEKSARAMKKEKSHGSAFWFYFSKDFANGSEKILKEME